MAVSIDWGSRVIFVPKADLTLIQATPTEIREMNLDWFRFQLKGLEDDPEGMPFPDTHRHNTEATVAGLTLARVIEIINDYTVTFEDGQYAVNLVGANSNVGDVVNVNQVSVRSFNSAGLISNPAIEYASYNGGVTVDKNSAYSGTLYPVGTPRQPVNNLADALLIAQYRGFTTFYIIGDMVIDSAGNYGGFIFVGESESKSMLEIDSDASVSECEFYDAHIEGILDGNAKLKNCIIEDLQYIYGMVEQCLLQAGTIVLGGSNVAHFIDCWSGSADKNVIPYIDMGGAGQDLILRNYNGAIGIKNLTGATNKVSIDLNSGVVVLDPTVTAGEVVVRGVGTVVNNSVGATVDTHDLINPDVITTKVWDEPTADRQTPGTIGGDYFQMLQAMPRMLGLVQENYKLDQTVYDANGNLTSGRIQIFTDATMTTVMASYQITAVFTAGRLTSYQVVKQ
jgi:hypothetical protein